MKKILLITLATLFFLCGAPITLYGMFLEWVFWWSIEVSLFDPFWKLRALFEPALWEATIITLVGAALVSVSGFLINLSEDK